MNRTGLLILLLFPLALSAEVFSLWPFSGNGTIVPDEVAGNSPLWTENVIVNGQSLELGVSMNQNPLDLCFQNLRKMYPDAVFAANKESLLAEIKLKNGLRRRMLLLSVHGIYPVLSFSMDLPASDLKPKDWPSEFPLPPGAKPRMTMRFPKREAVYGAFSSDFDVPQTLSSLGASLTAMGWKSVSGEHFDPSSGNGEIFMKENPSSLLIIGLTPRKDGRCFGTLYQRRNK